MPNQKGSLKDRLRSWFLFLKYKMKLIMKQIDAKKTQKMQKKQVQILASGKYYSKSKIFRLTILGLFFGLFESKEKKQVKSLEIRINELEQQIENNYLNNEIIREIQNIEQDILVTKRTNNKISLSKYETKLDNIKSTIKRTKKLEETNLKIEHTKEKDAEKSNISKTKITQNKYIPILEIKIFNQDLKKYNKQLKYINSKIKQTKYYDELYEYEFLIKQLQHKLNELLNQYESLKKLSGFSDLSDMIKVKDIDDFGLRKNNKKIKETISWCETTLLNIENKKQEILSTKKANSNTQKEVKKEIAKKEEKKKDKPIEKEKNKLSELILADKIIYDNILKEKRKIAKFNRQVSLMNQKQRKLNVFYYTRKLVSSILNLSFSIFPISLFKNKILGSLVSGVMINNSLRSVRKILKPDIEISFIYANIEKEIIHTSNYLNKMASVCDDSLKQIEDIRNTLYITYGNDIKYNNSLISYLDDLSKIESKLKYEQITLYGMNEDLNKVRKNNKQKIKQISHINN